MNKYLTQDLEYKLESIVEEKLRDYVNWIMIEYISKNEDKIHKMIENNIKDCINSKSNEILLEDSFIEFINERLW